MAKINTIKTFKITLGCCIAVLLAKALHLDYSNSVVTITLLSILNTKKDTLIVAGKRTLAFVLAVLTAILSFTVCQFSILGLGIYLLIIVILCQKFELTDGLSMSTVLMLHIWTTGSVTLSGLLNEAILMAIGIIMGIVMNLYMPNQIKKIIAYQTLIEKHFAELLLCFADRILLKENAAQIKQQFETLSPIFQQSIEATDLHVNNQLFYDAGYYKQYLKMRLKQFEVLQIIATNLERISCVPRQAEEISAFIKQVAHSIKNREDVQTMLDELQKMRSSFRQGDLPTDRQEFEARAVLFEIVNDMQYLLRIRKEFAESLSPYQRKTFWNHKN